MATRRLTVRTPWSDRVGAIVGAILVALLVLSLLWWEYASARHPGLLSLAVEECRVDYGRARTAADSTRVDQLIPATGAQKGWRAQSCGLLRHSGALK